MKRKICFSIILLSNDVTLSINYYEGKKARAKTGSSGHEIIKNVFKKKQNCVRKKCEIV